MASEKLYAVELDSGETALVRPTSIFLRQSILDEAERLHPSPDKALYEKPIPSALPGVDLKTLAEDNPDYRAELLKAKLRQARAIKELLIRSGIVVDTPEGKALTMERYAPALTAARALLANVPADDWLATVMYCLIATNTDVERIVAATVEDLTNEEIMRAVRSFRREVRG